MKRSAYIVVAAMLAMSLMTACQPKPPAESSSDSSAITTQPSGTAGTAEGAGTSGNPSGSADSSDSAASATNSHSTASSPAKSSTAAATTTTTAGGGMWGAARISLRAPAHGGLSSLTPTFEWTPVDADSFTFTLEEKTATGFKVIKKQENLKTATYKPDVSLKAATTYRWKVVANRSTGTVEHTGSTKGGAVFMSAIDPKKHAANAGKDFSFDSKISEQVLKNYLSRSMTLSMISNPSVSPDSDARMVLNTGAKYISRSVIPWQPETEYTDSINAYKEKISAMHKLDPDLIFETCIFETVWKSCEQTPIPDWVFRAFGKTPEKRNFSYNKMLFPNGKYVDHWEAGCSVPDVTQLETQMYFYYRACRYIDAGFEAIHWGQVMLIGETDQETGYKNYHKVLTLVRAYAQKNARRHFVLNNAHVHGMKGPDGKLLFDFHSYPFRGKVPAGEKSHAPSESNPQKVELEVGHLDSLFKKSMGGTTVSGWSCDSLPYVVELDNGGGVEPGRLNDPTTNYWIWGMDEITWFANQPRSYRASWLDYAYNWIRTTDSQGFLMMPGSRPAYMQNEKQMTWYFANSMEFTDLAWGDEEAIKSVWEKYKK